MGEEDYFCLWYTVSEHFPFNRRWRRSSFHVTSSMSNHHMSLDLCVTAPIIYTLWFIYRHGFITLCGFIILHWIHYIMDLRTPGYWYPCEVLNCKKSTKKPLSRRPFIWQGSLSYKSIFIQLIISSLSKDWDQNLETRIWNHILRPEFKNSFETSF